jgi:hypothetical protein
MTEEKSTPAGDTLHPSSLSDDDAALAVELFRRMNQNQRLRHLDYLNQVFNDSAACKPGAGVPDKTAERNRTFNREDIIDLDKEEFDLMEFDNDLYETLEGMGFNEETKQKCGELFYEAVEQRLFHEDSAFRAKVIEILEDFTSNPFNSDETIDAAEALANRIEELESQIAYVENENQQLYGEISQIHEETMAEDIPATERTPKRSTIEEHLFEADEENSSHFYNINMQENYADAQMRSYLNVLDRTKR